jgi:hypothetical protein
MEETSSDARPKLNTKTRKERLQAELELIIESFLPHNLKSRDVMTPDFWTLTLDIKILSLVN